MAGAFRLLKYTKATTNNINSVIETHQSKKSLPGVEMLYLTFSCSKIFYLHLEISLVKLAVSGCLLGISDMHSLLLLERIFGGTGEIT